MTARRHSAKWWALVVVHNLVVHPFLPLGKVADLCRLTRPLARGLFWLHDNTFPEGAG